MTITVEDGWLKGSPIRTARKDHRCADAARSERLGLTKCLRVIRKGDKYVEGDCDPDYAGGFGHDRYCMECADGQESHLNAVLEPTNEQA